MKVLDRERVDSKESTLYTRVLRRNSKAKVFKVSGDLA
jgi:hypothetical protein